MPRRKKQTRKILPPLAENLVSKLSNADARLRRKLLRIGFWTVGIVFFYGLMVGNYGLPRIVRLEMERKALEEENQQILLELIDASRQKQMLETDPLFIEEIARTRYHMVRPKETIYFHRQR